MPDFVAALEVKARRAEPDGHREEPYQTTSTEWRADIKDFQEEIVLVKQAGAAFVKEVASATVANARPVLG